MSNDPSFNNNDATRESADPADDSLRRPLWYWSEVAAAVGTPVPAGGPEVSGVSIDSRTLNSGDLFIALSGDPGERFFTSSPGSRDGHEFLGAAQEQGAAGALVSRTKPLDFAQVRIEDTLDGLWALGRAAVARHRGARIAITGSSGKTTAKAFLAAALGATAEPGSLNNFWGVPLCLARTPADARYAVYELGTNQAGEIAPLSTLVQPDVALMLNVHPAHVGNFSSLAALKEEKLSIFSGLQSISNMVCENSVAESAGLADQVWSFGEQPQAKVRLLTQRGDSASFAIPGGRLDARVPGGGRHRALTLAAVIAALLALQKDPALAAELSPNLVPKGRGDEQLVERANGGEWLVINDSYNANPASMAAALTALTDRAGTSTGPAFAVLGEMLELGDGANQYHLGLREQCEPLTGVFCVGEGMRALADALPADKLLGYAKTAAEIDLPTLLAQLPDSGQLLVKGSNPVFWQSGYVETLTAALRAP